MTARTLEAPSAFTVTGTMLPGSSCSNATSPTYEAITADGKSGAFFLPRMDWARGSGWNNPSDCLPFQSAISVKEFLTYFIRVRKLGFVEELPIPDLADLHRSDDEQNQWSRSRGMPSNTRGDLARFLVRYSVNGQATEESITAMTNCSETMVLGVGRTHLCSAFVTRWFAPLGKLQSMTPQFNAMKLNLIQQWMVSWTAAMVQRISRLSQAQTQVSLAQGKIAGDQRMIAHQQFINSMQLGRDIRNDRFVEGQYNKTQNKEDFVDHITDCQRASNGYVQITVGACQTRETATR